MGTQPGSPFEIRTATEESLHAFLEPLVPAFAEEYSEEEFEADRHFFEPERVIGAFEADRLVGCAGAYSVRLTVPGGDVAAGGVTLVAVLPTHRRRGALRALMAHQLDDIRRRHEPVAILWASEGAIYQRFGYGLATYATSFEIDPRRSAFLRPAPTTGRLRFLSAEEAFELLPELYERAHRPIPGALSRSEAWWRWVVLRDSAVPRQEMGRKFYVVLEEEDRPVGYAIYRARAQWDDRGPEGRLTVIEIVADDVGAERRLWRWLLDIDLVGKLRAIRQPLLPPLFLMLAEPRRLGLTVADGLWLRLVDVPAALGSRRYAADGSLVLEVADETCPWNAGRWRLTSSEGTDRRAGLHAGAAATGSDSSRSAEAVPTDDLPDLELDVADLGAAFLGGVRFAELAAAGRVVERVEGAVVRADRLFAVERPPWCVTMF